MQAARFQPGLCSVTFRALPPEAIIDLASTALLAGIEWASDVHVTPGDTKGAERVAALCADSGLRTPSLGSYVRSVSSPSSQAFAPVLDSCLALGANTIRIWAGDRGFDATPAGDRMAIAETIHGYCEDAARHNVTVSVEYHPNTLTDHVAGARWLLDQVDHEGLRTYWQPVPDQTVDSCLADVALIADRLSNIHVFYWVGDKVRRPLADGSDYWRAVVSGIEGLLATDRQPSDTEPEDDRWAFMEFVRNDDVAQFRSDSRTFVDQIVSGQA